MALPSVDTWRSIYRGSCSPQHCSSSWMDHIRTHCCLHSFIYLIIFPMCTWTKYIPQKSLKTVTLYNLDYKAGDQLDKDCYLQVSFLFFLSHSQWVLRTHSNLALAAVNVESWMICSRLAEPCWVTTRSQRNFFRRIIMTSFCWNFLIYAHATVSLCSDKEYRAWVAIVERHSFRGLELSPAPLMHAGPRTRLQVWRLIATRCLYSQLC